MTDFKEQWNVEMALEVLRSKTVDGNLWTEAVKWLMIYGPPEIKDLLLQASGMTMEECFPELKPQGYTDQGLPCYNLSDLASALGTTEEETFQKLAELEADHNVRHLFGSSETNKIQ